MRILDVEQGTDEWLRARIGHPTASKVDMILTPKGLNPSGQRQRYRNMILAEWLVGRPIDWTGSTPFMERGREMEPEARAWYEFQYDVEVQTVGHVLNEDGTFGGSPDGLVGEDGGLEIKVPALHTHISYLLGEEHDHRGQVQAYLYLTGREWWDLLSYHPELTPVVTRIEPDADYIEALDAVLGEFIAELAEAMERLEPHRSAEIEYTGAADADGRVEGMGASAEAPEPSEREELYARWLSVWDERHPEDDGSKRIAMEVSATGKRATEWTAERLRWAIDKYSPAVTTT